MSDSHHRHLRPLTEPEEPIRRGRNVIAVVGIDQYQHLRLLHNAVSDAKGIRSLFVDHLGFQELVPPLYNEQATRGAITSLVIDQLGSKLQPDDSLVFFFAGHGYTETRIVGTRTRQTGYLIPVEGSPLEQRKFSTYLRLDAFLEELASLPPMHILVILDACHSGFALGESVQVLRDVQRYSDDLSKRMSRRVIASAMSDQPALDNGPVSGHSLFTGTLVEALAHGKADAEHKGFVTSSEVALYVQKKVASWSSSQQTPDFGSFELDDRGELVISLVGETQSRQLAQESLQIADHVMELGWITGDAKRFTFAAQQYREALRHALLGKSELPAAEVGLGRALLAAGETDEAIQLLAELVERTGTEESGEAQFYLGFAHAKQRNYDDAANLLKLWLAGNPEHEDAAWVSAYIMCLQNAASSPSGRRRALLIGINEYQLASAFTLPGCINDIEHLIQPLIIQRCDFQPDDILLLKDGAATREGVLAAFEMLRQQSLPGDTVLIHYSGHSVPSSQPLLFGHNDQDVYWILHDTHEKDGRMERGITALELHNLVKSIPATHKTLILDTHGNWSLVELAEKEGDYNLILASDTAEVALEWSVTKDGEKLPCGMLTGALYQSVVDASDASALTYNDWINQATQITQKESVTLGSSKLQTPLFIGQRDQPLFGRHDPYLSAFEFSQRTGWSESSEQLIGMYNRSQALLHTPFARATEAFGRAFYEKAAYPQAIAALQQTTKQSQESQPLTLRTLAFAQAMVGDFQAAQKSLKQYARLLPAAQKGEVAKMLEQLQEVIGKRRKVVIFHNDPVSSDPENGEATSPVASEPRDAVKPQLTALTQVLAEKYGESGYTLELVNLGGAAEAEQRIYNKMQALVAQPDDLATLVCIFGGGDYNPDARMTAEHIFKRCSEIVRGKPFFLWLQGEQRIQINNPPAEIPPINHLDTLARCLEQVDPLRSTNAALEKELQRLVEGLENDQITLPEPRVAHPGDDQLFLSNQQLRDLLLEMHRAEQRPLRESASFLQEVVDQREARDDLWPEGRLQLGVAYALLEDYANAERVLDEVIRICRSGGKYMEEQFSAA